MLLILSSVAFCVFWHLNQFIEFLFNLLIVVLFFFFFQAEDGIRDWSVTGVQTCALPISWGWFGFGQFIDLFLIPEMVDEHNLKRRSLLSGYYPGVGNTQPVAAVPKAEPTNGEMMMQLVQAANKYGGKLSVTQGVMATGLEFDKVEEVLSQMLKSGYVSIGNDPNSGVVIYDFHEL